GISVGKDMMGTMSNTLVLAFAGGSLSLLVLNYTYDLSMNQILNSSSICIEIMQGISVSIGVVMTVPIVCLLASALIPRWTPKAAQEPEVEWDGFEGHDEHDDSEDLGYSETEQ